MVLYMCRWKVIRVESNFLTGIFKASKAQSLQYVNGLNPSLCCTRYLKPRTKEKVTWR